jgi:ABC-type antimicrobial peptide transport system permease subunit
MTYELRTAGDPLALAAVVRQVVYEIDPRVPLSDLGTQTRRIDQTIAQERTFATLCSCFAVLAVLIACIGLYGTLAHNVARRSTEFGIRMALGAERHRLVWMVLRQVLVMAGAGLAIGLAIATALSRVVATFLFQVKPTDPIIMLAAAVTLLSAALAAGYGPARRASRLHPWTVLRD